MLLADAASRFSLVPVRGDRLITRIDVLSSARRWSAEDEALEWGEFIDLARWLRDVGRGKRRKCLEFSEPNLTFELLENKDAEARIRIWVEGELRPEWAPYTDWNMRDLAVELTCSHRALIEAADSLRAEIARI